jgi:hypothetical protein
MKSADSTSTSFRALLDRLQRAANDWDAAGNVHGKTAGKATTQQKSSYCEGKADGYYNCSTALTRIISEFENA